jgi:ubiquinone/menaquinone biosynthesis C-methylase UbiE
LKDKYVLGSVKEEQKRLNIQSIIFENETRRTLDLAGIKAGMCCVDLGCGAGDTSFLLAKIVGNKGHVIGIDINENAIKTCKKRAGESNSKNTQFFVRSIYDTQLKKHNFDLVFSRFLFQHLKEPEKAIREMSRIAKKNGMLVIEELDHGSWLCYPSEPSLEKLRQMYVKLLQMNGSDPFIARKLYKIFAELGFQPDVYAYTVTVTTDKRPFNNLGVQLAKTLEPQIIKNDLMSQKEFDHMLERIQKYSNSPHRLVLYATTFRVWSRNNPTF